MHAWRHPLLWKSCGSNVVVDVRVCGPAGLSSTSQVSLLHRRGPLSLQSIEPVEFDANEVMSALIAQIVANGEEAGSWVSER
jgi:hypothetical protein